MLVGFVSGIWLRYLSLLILSNHHPPGAFVKFEPIQKKGHMGFQSKIPKENIAVR